MKRFLFITTLLAMSFTREVQAATFDLSVSPAIFQIELTPPAVAHAERTILLENTGDEVLELEILYQPFSSSKSENGEIVFESTISGADPDILKKVTIVDEGKIIESVILSPQQKKELDLIVTIPKDEPPSDYYFTVLFLNKNAENESTESSLTTTQGGIGINVLLSIGPKSQTSGVIEEFSTPLFFSNGPVPFTVRVTNTSKHFIYPKGNIVIKNMFGQAIGKVTLLPVNILSNSTRALPSGEQFIYAANDNTEENKVIDKIQRLTKEQNKPIAVWPETFLLGPYSAELTIALSPEGPMYTRTIRFIGFPYQLLLGVGVIALVILIIRARLHQKERLS